MVLAGKLGLYSILRFSFGIFPDQSRHVAPVLIALGAIGIVYGSLIALIKTDLKKLAAFSTLAHVSFVILGIFTFTVLGLDGGIFQILNESLIGAALFILLGLLYERYGTYDMRDYGGLATRHPWMVTMFVITSLAAVGLPMFNGFVGEFLILSGTMQSIVAHHILWTVIGATGVIFGATYMLWMIQRLFYGSVGIRPDEVPGYDLTAREHLELWPLAALFLIMGIASPSGCAPSTPTPPPRPLLLRMCHLDRRPQAAAERPLYLQKLVPPPRARTKSHGSNSAQSVVCRT